MFSKTGIIIPHHNVVIKNVRQPGMTKNTSHRISIYGKMLVIHFSCNSIRTENCMKGLWLVFFSYMEIVWLAFFHKPKILIFYILISQNFLVVFVTEHKWHKPWLLKRSNQRFGLLTLKMHWKQPICVTSVSDKQYNESNELINFGNNFQRWLLLKFEFSNYQTLIKAFKNMSYKRTRSFKRFWKRKKIQYLYIQDYVIHTKS